MIGLVRGIVREKYERGTQFLDSGQCPFGHFGVLGNGQSLGVHFKELQCEARRQTLPQRLAIGAVPGEFGVIALNDENRVAGRRDAGASGAEQENQESSAVIQVAPGST